MCTVTYIPTEPGSFILTTNRDEAPGRSPEQIDCGPGMIFPRDTKAGGTWVAASTDGRVACLLNGAFDQHHRNPPYRMSRGLMLLAFFSYKKATDFFGQYDFTNIEPFTMVIFEGDCLFDYRWDGKKQYISGLNNEDTHIWSSATLYGASAQARRQAWFEEWKQEKEFYPEAIRRFHFHAGDGDPWNDVIMNRNGMVRTVSITQVIKQKHAVEMHYFDLLRAGLDTAKINIEGEKDVEST